MKLMLGDQTGALTGWAATGRARLESGTGTVHRGVRLARRHPASATAVLWGLILLGRLFIGGTVGMADNFDGHRLLCQLGVAPHPIPAGQALWAYVTPRYDAYTWYGEACSAGGTGQPYLSTEYFPLWIAKQLTWLFGLPGALDLRMLGVVFAAGVAAAVGWTVRELPGPTWSRVLIASGIGLAAADSAIAPYYISPFSEPAALLGMLLLIPALLRLLSREQVRVRDLALVAVITLWTIGAKTQMASLLLAIVPILLLRPCLRARGRSKATATKPGRVLRGLVLRAPALVACTMMIAATAEFEQHQSRWMNEIVLYDDVFRDVLGHSPDVPGDLRALHLPAGFAPAAGSSIVAPNSAAGLPIYPYFVQHETFGDVLTFYATHPVRLFGVADRGFTGISDTRPSYLGNYLASSGAAPYEQECRMCVAAAAFTLAEPFRWVVIPGLWIAALFFGIRLARRRRAPARARGVGIVLAGLATATVAQFWTVMLTEGDSDIDKHLVFVVFGTMLLGPLAAAALVAVDQRTEPGKAAAAPVSRQSGPETPEPALPHQAQTMPARESTAAAGVAGGAS